MPTKFGTCCCTAATIKQIKLSVGHSSFRYTNATSGDFDWWSDRFPFRKIRYKFTIGEDFGGGGVYEMVAVYSSLYQTIVVESETWSPNQEDFNDAWDALGDPHPGTDSTTQTNDENHSLTRITRTDDEVFVWEEDFEI
jgi:hypothetical protein